jgi:hypothetical protein
VEPAATGGTDGSQMQTPPPVSGEPFPTVTGAEARSNYLDPGLAVEASYNDNLLPGYVTNPISTMGYSINPSLEFDKVTPRLHQTWTYSASFTLYQHATGLNAADQHAALDLHYLVSPHIAISGRDTFEKGSNLFNQPSLGGPISGSASSSPADYFAPFEDRLSNQSNAGLSYQFSAHGMIGASGSSTLLHFLNQAQSSGLADSNSFGGSAFYNHQMTATQYMGATYQYSKEADSFASTQTSTHVNTVNIFYTLYLVHALTLSVMGGPQHYSVVQSPLPPSAAWTPTITGSIAWQGNQTNFAASYSKSVAGGGGLFGAFNTTMASASARWQFARTWTVQSAVNYNLRKSVTPLFFFSESGGRSISGTATLEHPLSEHLRASLSYQRLHQSYGGLAAIIGNPDSDRESISISYQFTRPLGR